MIEKLIHLQKSSLNTLFLKPSVLKNENVYLVFLHEALGSIPQWRDFPFQLCQKLGLQGIVYERQGHGKSSAFSKERTDRYLRDYALEELPEFLNSVLPYDSKIMLIGHSDGGSIALLFAKFFPKRVLGMVTMAAHIENEEITRNGIYPAIEAYKSGKLDGLKKYHFDKTDSLFKAWSETWLSEAFKTWSIESEIQGILVPALIIQGKEDQYGSEAQVSKICQACIVSEGCIIPACKHHPHLERSEFVLEKISTWVTTRHLIS